jgi:hypothetical protein
VIFDRPTEAFRLKVEGPLAPYQLPMPAQDRIRAEDQHRLYLCMELTGRPPQLGDKDRQQCLFEARETLWLARLMLQHTNLLS